MYISYDNSGFVLADEDKYECFDYFCQNVPHSTNFIRVVRYVGYESNNKMTINAVTDKVN